MPARLPRITAFTLVELLVTVSIIAVLLGILIPSISSSRRQAKLVACGANLRTIGQLIQAYAQENDGRIPAGPSLRTVSSLFALRDSYIATSQVWTQYPDPAADPPDPAAPRCLRSWLQLDVNNNGITDGQYMGLGLLSRDRDASGNKYLFCPADDKLNFPEESAKIGDDTAYGAYSSYLYRQLDLTPPEIECQGRLDGLGINARTGPGIGQANQGGSGNYRLEVHALALDANSVGIDDSTTTSSHGAEKVNMVYKDGSVATFENKLQLDNGIEKPWASIPQSAYASYPDLSPVRDELDRIFLAGDFSYVRKEPWLAPVP